MAAPIRPNVLLRQLCTLYKNFTSSQGLQVANEVNSIWRGKVKYDKSISFCVNRAFHSTAVQNTRRFQEFSTVTEAKVIENEQKPTNTGLVQQVNNALQYQDVGRLFAVVHVRGKQRKVTAEDIIVVEGDFQPTVGDRIRLEKVLMVGCKDFSLVGRPVLSRNMVSVEATVVEKTLSHFRINFNYIKRKNYKKFKVRRMPQTMLLINSIELLQKEVDS